MSEAQTRPAAPRGRGSARGGRGGFSNRPGRTPASKGASSPNGDVPPQSHALPTLDDEGDVGELKKKWGSKVMTIKEMFPDWSEIDILYALNETDGDENMTVTRMADGTISQWGEVSKQKKDRARSKAKEPAATSESQNGSTARPTRGNRNFSEAGRGRGRATERGARATRGRPAQGAAATSRSKENQPPSAPAEEASTWGAETTAPDAPAVGTAAKANATNLESSITAPQTSTQSDSARQTSSTTSAAAKTWASMLRQTAVPKAAPKVPDAPAIKDTALEPSPPVEQDSKIELEDPAELVTAEPTTEHGPPGSQTPDIALPPSKDKLTEDNVEQIADESQPNLAETVRSVAADSWDPRAAPVSSTATPMSAAQQQHQLGRLPPPTSGYAATAQKAAEGGASRTAGFPSRRFLDQQEAVRMPGNRDVDRTAVQFGAFNLGGSEDDIDGDREEPETRTQPPADSPVAQPRAALPPSQPTADTTAPGSIGSSFPGSAAAPLAPSGSAAHSLSAARDTPMSQQSAQPLTNQSARYGDEATFGSQKPYDPYTQQQANPATSQPQYDTYSSQQQSLSHAGQPQAGGAYGSAGNDYSSYYGADQHSRQPYSYYGQGYGQQQAGQTGHVQQDSGSGGRAGGFGGYGLGQSDLSSQYPQSSNASRFGPNSTQDLSTSGNTTPNPAVQSQQQTTAPGAGHSQSHAAQQQQSHAGGQNPYSNYYNNSYYHNYASQYGGYGQPGYGAGSYGKNGAYGQPHQYGMGQQGGYEHSSSPAPGYPQSAFHRSDSNTGTSLNDYGRGGSTQSGNQQGFGHGGFGGMQDAFGRGASSYGGQSAHSYGAAAGQQSNGAQAAGDDLKPFGEGKTTGMPTPSLGMAARPSSAANNGGSQSGLPPSQGGQQSTGGYGGYQSHYQSQGLHGNPSSSAGAYGASGAGAAQQSNAYSGYGGLGGNTNSSYYGQQQQQQGQSQQATQPQQSRGWGNNYSN